MTTAIRSGFLSSSPRACGGHGDRHLRRRRPVRRLLRLGTDVRGEPEPTGRSSGDATQIANTVYTSGMGVGYLLLLTIGVLMIGAEYRHKTITSTFLATPKRLQAMLAKVVALLVIGALYGLISIVSSVGVGATVPQARWPRSLPVERGLPHDGTPACSCSACGGSSARASASSSRTRSPPCSSASGVAWIVEPVAGLLLGFWDFGAEHIVKLPPQPGHECRGQLSHQGGQQVARLGGPGLSSCRVCRGARRVRHLADPCAGRLPAPAPHADGGFGVCRARGIPRPSVRRGRVTTGRTLGWVGVPRARSEIGWTDHPSPTTQ